MIFKRPVSAFNRHHHGGFTLIEVLIALTIIAISLGALMSASGNQAYQTGYLKQKTLAHWVAMNEMTRLHVEEEWPALGEKKGRSEMAGAEWFWLRTVKETQDDNARGVEFVVFADKSRKQNLIHLIGYVNK